MAKSVYVPEAGGIIDFPDEATPQQMLAYIEGNYGTAKAAPAPAEEGVGPWESAGLGWLSRVQTAGGGFAESLGYGDTAKYFYDKAQKNLEESQKYQPKETSITGAETWGGSAEALGEAAIQSAPDLAGGLAAGYVGGQIGAGIGALGGPFAPATVPAGALVGGLLGAGLYSFGVSTGSNIQRQAQEKGVPLQEADEGTAIAAAAAQAPLDAIADRILLGKLIPSGAPANVVRKIVGEGVVKHAIKGATAEGLTEAAQQAIEVGQANPEKLFDFSPEVQAELADAAFAGGFLGGGVGAASVPAGKIADYYRAKPFRQLQKDLGTEGVQNLEALRQGQISQTAEELRQYNVEGLVDVAEEEVDGITKFTIKSPAGNSFGRFDTPEDAQSAIERYSQATGAKVSLRTEPSSVAPSVLPIKVGKTKYGSFDELRAARDTAIQQREAVAKLVTDPDLLKKQAAVDKVPEDYYRREMFKEVQRQDKIIGKLSSYLPEEQTAPAPTAVKTTSKAIPYDTVTYDKTKGKVYSSGEAPVIDYGGRKITIKNINGVDVPFYLSSGMGGKQDVAAGKWYPFFGIGKNDGWINKTSGDEMSQYYGVPEFKAAAEELDAEFGDIRNDETVPKVGPTGQHIDYLNNGFDPADNNAPDTLDKVQGNIDAVVSRIRTPETPAVAANPIERPIGSVEPVQEEISTQEPVVPESVVADEAKPEVAQPQRTAPPPEPRPFTPEYQAKMNDVYTALQSELEKIAPPDIKLKLQTLVDSKPGYLMKGQSVKIKTDTGIERVIELSRGIFRPDMTVEQMVKEMSDTLNHEVIHALRDAGLFRQAEWNVLSKSALNAKVPGKSYTYLDRANAIYRPNGVPISDAYTSEEALVEEAIADMYKDWVKERKAPQQAQGLLNRITEFFRSVFRVFRNTRHVDVFKTIDEGKLLDREIAEPVGAPSEGIAEQKLTEDAKFSAAPLPPYVEQRNRTLFRPQPEVPFYKSMFDFFFGHPTTGKTLNTIYGNVDMSAATRFATSARVAGVDSAAYVEYLEKAANEKATGNFERLNADYSATAALAWFRRSSQLTASTIMMGKPSVKFDRAGDIQSATIAAEEDPDSLMNVFKILLEPGPTDSATGEVKDKREIFKTYATAMRAIGLKAAGKPVPRELDDTYIREAISSARRDYPDVVRAYEMYQRFNKNLLTAARDAGVISPQELAALSQKMDYYGFYREVFEEELVPGTTTRAAAKFDLREYKGSEYGNLIDDPMFVIVQNTQFWMNAIARNLATTKAFKLAKDMGEARMLTASEKPNPANGEADQVMFFRENGAQRRFAVKDPMLVTALGSDDRMDMGKAMKLMGMPTQFIRESVTRDPAFMITNLVRDTLSSWITSGEDITPFLGTAAGFAKALKGSASFQALMGRGVVGSYDLAMREPQELAAILRRRLMPKNVHSLTSPGGATRVVATLWDRLGVWSEASDAATRIAVYEAAKSQGLSEAEATFRAIQIMDFSRHGSSTTLAMLTKLVPFLNARIQGLDVLYQAGRAGIRVLGGKAQGERDANLGKKFLVRGAMLAAISLALEYLNDDDEAYDELPDYIKKSNLLIPLKGFGLENEFLAIAKPFEAGLLFSTLPQQFYKTMQGEASTRDNINFFVESYASTFGVNPIPQIALPALEIIVNHDFYTGLPLISEGKARLSPELQYDSRTSTLARMLGDIPIMYNLTTGRFEGVSPIIIDQLIGGYAGPFGTLMASAVGMGMEGVDVGPERLPRAFSEMPVIKRFFVDAESRSPKTVAQAYELFRIVDEANRSFSRLRQTGDAEAVADYLEENRDVLTYKKYIYKLVDSLNKLSSQERQIERDKTMTDAEKREAMNRLREVRKRLTAKVSEINKALGR